MTFSPVIHTQDLIKSKHSHVEGLSDHVCVFHFHIYWPNQFSTVYYIQMYFDPTIQLINIIKFLFIVSMKLKNQFIISTVLL